MNETAPSQNPGQNPGQNPAEDPAQKPTEAQLRALFSAAAQNHRHGRLAPAIAGYLAVLREIPDMQSAKDNLALALLASGDYERGLRIYEARFDRTDRPVSKPKLPLPEWDGRDLAGGSLLVWPEQGLGDQIMYARFARTLRQRGVASLTWVAPRELAALFGHLPATIVEYRNEMGLPRADAWCMAGSLALKLGVTLATLPAEPYLPSLPGGRGVGVKANGRPTHHDDANRSLPPEIAAELLALPGARSLEPEATGAADFEATRQIVAGLDSVVTVDTSVAHLAGAMGKPTFLMLPYTADWRWMTDRSDSPWYPSMRLFRQPSPGDWTSVIAQVRAALEDRPGHQPA